MDTNLGKEMSSLNTYNYKKICPSILVFALITACSSVPDAMNPVEWYRDTVDLISNDKDTVDEANQSSSDNADDFPVLSSVPELSSIDNNNEMEYGLVADPNKPLYAEAPSRQSEEDEIQPPPEPSIDVNLDLQPSPPAQPALEVTAVELPLDTSTAVEIPLNASTSVVPLTIKSGQLPSGETYEDYRARLMAGLKETDLINKSAFININSSSNQFDPLDLETIVISSSGIDMTTTYTSHVKSSTSVINQSGFQQIPVQGGEPLVSPESVKVATIHFNNGSSSLDLNDLQILQKVAVLQQRSGGMVRVIGHASSRTRSMDPVKHKMVNYNVSAARADAIARQLVKLGAAKISILVGAASDSQPKYFEVMPTGEAGNRRAEIYIDS